MLYVHPILQMAATALALWALVLAWPRIATLHLKRRMVFKRPRHVFWGKLGLGLMLAGLLGGLLVVRLVWQDWLVTGEHALVGLIMLPLLGLGLMSGLVLAGSRSPRRGLALLHGLNNLALLVLASLQMRSGGQLLAALAGMD